MSQEFFISDNAGNRTAPGCEAADPILASGQNIICPVQNLDHEVDVVAGASYALTALVGPHIFGIASIDTSDANGIWACGEGKTIIIKIPIPYTTLYCQTPDTTAFHRVILRRLKD